jgi:catechol 2,3-dioxygenase-like lactoylglutathione lyase family enzyme
VSIRRVVPNIQTERSDESREFWSGLLGFRLGMDQGWIQTFVSPSNPTAQVSIIRADQSAPVVAAISVEVGDVDRIHAEAERRGLEIVHPLTDEPWGVRRFFVRAPDGTVVNIAAHRPAAASAPPAATPAPPPVAETPEAEAEATEAEPPEPEPPAAEAAPAEGDGDGDGDGDPDTDTGEKPE